MAGVVACSDKCKKRVFLEKMLKEMRELDIKGSFESDDEVGVVFKELKDIIEKYKSNI